MRGQHKVCPYRVVWRDSLGFIAIAGGSLSLALKDWQGIAVKGEDLQGPCGVDDRAIIAWNVGIRGAGVGTRSSLAFD